ncbi:ABC transporter substrate-binding protein [Chloroflexota bacterium]
MTIILYKLAPSGLKAYQQALQKVPLVISFLLILGLLLAACAIDPQIVEEIVTVEVAVDTATPEPEIKKTFHAADPETWTSVNFGDADTLDPGWNYETVGNGIVEDIYDTLVTYAGADANTYVPKLATEWEVLDEGATYVFTIRQGVKFHEGQDLDVGDVAYSFQRGLLQGGGWSPQWLYTEAFFGTGVYDITCLIDDNLCEHQDNPETLKNADHETLTAVCQRVTNAIVADEAAGTVTFYLSQPWAPLLATLSGAWGSIVDRDWAMNHGAWDGDCATWQNFYGMTSESTPLRDITNGTGPYILDHWTPGQEIVLTANENYWQTEPLYEGGPSGAARLKRILNLQVDEWGTRFAMLQAGDADKVSVPPENRGQVDPLVGEICTFVNWGIYDCRPSENPNQPLRLLKGTPSTSRTDAMFVMDINVDGGNQYVGSGKMDGNGIPADFFMDMHVRRAFNYCFDWDTYIAEVFQGEAIQNYGPVNQGMLGYDPEAVHYSFDPEMCQSEIEQAWGGAVAENGFRMQIGFNTGNTTRQTIAQILQANFADIDSKYNIEIIGLPWPSFLDAIRNVRLPVYVSGWGEDIHDPHNWVQPFLMGTYADRQNFPQEWIDQFSVLVNAGVAGRTAEERIAAYLEIQKLDYELAPAIRLAVATGRSYHQRWVSDYVINPMLKEPVYLWAKE